MIQAESPIKPTPNLEPGWKWLYTRGYALGAPSSYARRWMLDRAKRLSYDILTPPSAGYPNRISLKSRGQVQSGRMMRVSTWQTVPPDGVTLRDGIYRGGRLQLLSEDRYRFMGGQNGGCIVEVKAFRKPVAFPARVGFLLLPRWSERSIQE
jgi:hypothetical protein